MAAVSSVPFIATETWIFFAFLDFLSIKAVANKFPGIAIINQFEYREYYLLCDNNSV